VSGGPSVLVGPLARGLTKALGRMTRIFINNFIILAIKVVLNMLNVTGCQELSHLCGLAPSDASIMQNVPTDVQRLAGRLVQKWWKIQGLPVALRRLDIADTEP
jgi:hypothetical protein